MVYIESKTPLVEEEDKCLNWMRKKARLNAQTLVKQGALEKGTFAEKLKSSLDNDTRACSELRWSKFAFPSEPNTPLSNKFNNENNNRKFRIETTGDHDLLQLVEGDGKNAEHKSVSLMEKEPSRNIFRTVVMKERYRDEWYSMNTKYNKKGAVTYEGYQDQLPSRPDYGGYFTFPHPNEDSFRFLIFPQAHHSLLTEDGELGPFLEESVKKRQRTTPQPVDNYWRGSLREDINESNSVAVETQEEAERNDQTHWRRYWRSWKFNLYGATKRKYGKYDVVETEVSLHQNKTERQYSEAKDKVQRCKFLYDGIEMKGSPNGNPRYTDSVRVEQYLVDSEREKKEGEGATRILSLLWQNQYESATQYFNLPQWWIDWVKSSERVQETKKSEKQKKKESKSSDKDRSKEQKEEEVVGKYVMKWRGGPGVEHCSEDRKMTFFGSLWSYTKLVLPLPKRFELVLHNQNSIVSPFEKITPKFISPECEKEKESSSSTLWKNNTLSVAPHRYFWATQCPKWEEGLLRGFSNDYKSLHHAKRWYSIISAEIGRKKKENQSLSFFGNAGIKGFLNLCFVDSLFKYPRASIGFSMVSDFPRQTVDAFNKIVPSTFECSFSWFIAFDEKTLKTGLQPGKSEAEQFMRVSPVETFRHMKCGLTWKFE